MNEAVQELHRLPFSERLTKQADKILLSDVRGQHKLPGEYRKSQNWIGGATFDSILKIQKTLDSKLKPLGRRATDAHIVINELFRNPIINAAKVEVLFGKSSDSAFKLITDLVDVDILKETTGGQRGRIYVFKDYVDLFK